MSAHTHFVPLTLVLPADKESCSHCTQRLQSVLAVEAALDEVHLVEKEDASGLCIHYDPEKINLPKLDSLVTSAGARLADQYRHVNLYITGMDCSDCSALIEHHLERMPGILSAKVSYASEQLVVEYDRKITSLAKIKKRIKPLGFKLHEQAPRAAFWAKYKEILISLTAGAILLLSWLLSKPEPTLSFALTLTAFAIAGFFTIRHSLHALKQKQVDIDVLMIIAAFGAGAIGAWFEGALLLFLFSLGHALEHFAMDKARHAVKALASLAPATAMVIRDGQQIEVPSETLAVGDSVLVKPGTRIPCDGEILEGNSAIDQAPITGESVPVDKTQGDEVFAGTINGQGTLTLNVTKASGDTVLSRMVRMVLEADTQRSPTQRFTLKFVKLFVPLVLITTLLLIFVPPLLLDESFKSAFYRAMAVLVAASPCALAIGTPSAVLSGVARAAHKGVLVKGGLHLENLGGITAIAFDKTGTLTQGKPIVSEMIAFDISENELLVKTASVETFSQHPLAQAVVNAAHEKNLSLLPVEEIHAQTGLGITGMLEKEMIAVGNLKLFKDVPDAVRAQATELQAKGHTIMIVKHGDRWLGLIGLADTPRPESADTLKALSALGIEKTIMLTGDNQRVGEAIAKEIGITEVLADLMPEDKLKSIATLEEKYHAIAMVGDGVNDAPAMTRATVGIAMGGAGTDVALEAADIALMNDDLSLLPFAVGLSRRARRIIKQNLYASLGIVAFLVGMTISGLAGIGVAVAIHEGSSLLVVMNSLRLLRYKR